MDGIHGAKEELRGEKDGARKKKSRGRGDRERRKRVSFYAQVNQICQLLEDGKLGWRESDFFSFSKKTKIGKKNRVLLEML